MSKQQTETSVFDAAKWIVEALKGLNKPSQTLALRFASESLGLSGVAVQGPSPSSTPLPQGGSSPTSQPELRGATHLTDIKQFTAAKAPKSDQQFATVAAYFYGLEAPESAGKDAVDGPLLQVTFTDTVLI